MAVRVLCFPNSIRNAVNLTDMLARSMSTGPKNIGFVGLGNMGGPMASNLMKKVCQSTECTRCYNMQKLCKN
jgi:3-hydroxyisobutyrate/3-hydroxypropionate dehydrogenase